MHGKKSFCYYTATKKNLLNLLNFFSRIPFFLSIKIFVGKIKISLDLADFFLLAPHTQYRITNFLRTLANFFSRAIAGLKTRENITRRNDNNGSCAR